MGFLDNLESNLENLESREEAAGAREHENRQAERARALAAAPWADRLRNGPFAKELLSHATRIGFSQRLKVRPAWIGSTFRLEAGERRLDLEPTPDGIAGHARSGQQPARTFAVDLEGSAEALARDWLA